MRASARTLSTALLPLLLLALPSGAPAQDEASPPPVAAPAAPAPAPSGLEPALNVEAGGPQWLSANLGFRVALPKNGVDGGRGLLFQVQPGIGGIALNVGYAPVTFEGNRLQAVGVALKARLLRTYGSPLGTEPGRTYAGVEGAVAIGVKLSAGVLWKLDDGEGKDTLFTWGIGLGL